MSINKNDFVDFLENYLLEEEAKELEITVTGEEEADAPMVDSPQKANYFLKLMIAIEKDINDINAICDMEIAKTTERVNHVRDEQIRPLANQYEYYKKILRSFTEHQIADSKKKSIGLPYGTLSIKNQPAKWNYDDDALLEWAKKNAPALVNTKTTESVVKNDLKKIVDKEGTMVKLNGQPVEGVYLAEQPPTFNIKVK